jgi:hypothetical protein
LAFLTIFYCFFYNIFYILKNSFFVSQNIYSSGFFFETIYLEIVILLFISTLCSSWFSFGKQLYPEGISWFLKKKGYVFQQKIFNILNIIPRFVFYCIKTEYFLTKNLFVGLLLAQSLIFIIFFLFFIGWDNFVFFKIFIIFIKHIFLVPYLLFRNLYDVGDFKKEGFAIKNMNKYEKILQLTQKGDITFNRNFLIISIFCVISLFYKICKIYLCIVIFCKKICIILQKIKKKDKKKTCVPSFKNFFTINRLLPLVTRVVIYFSRPLQALFLSSITILTLFSHSRLSNFVFFFILLSIMFVFLVYLFCIFTCSRYMKNLKGEGLLNALVTTLSVLTKTEVTILTGAIAVEVVVQELIINDVQDSMAPLVVPILTKEQLVAQVAAAGIKTVARTLSVLTKTEVTALAGASALAVVGEEVTVNNLRNSTASNEEKFHNDAGRAFKAAGRPESAEHEFLHAGWAQRLNEARTKGGFIVSSCGSAYSTKEYDQLETQSKVELAASRSNAEEETHYWRQRERDERDRRDRQEDWDSKSTVAKVHDHIERAASTVENIPVFFTRKKRVGRFYLQQLWLLKKNWNTFAVKVLHTTGGSMDL